MFAFGGMPAAYSGSACQCNSKIGQACLHLVACQLYTVGVFTVVGVEFMQFEVDRN